MDEKLFNQMGIPAERWDWTPGKVVHDTTDWYPHMPGYGLFLDPPYEINGQIVRGGPGWVVMSARDLARFGLLVATGGVWKGKRLISDTPLLTGHGGGNGSLMFGWNQSMFAWGQNTTQGISPEGLAETIRGPVKAPKNARSSLKSEAGSNQVDAGDGK